MTIAADLAATKGCFVTGIGTDVGKTVAAAVLAEALGWDYWKPVQCGNLAASDSERVHTLAPQVTIWPEAHRLELAASPHAAAAAEGVAIKVRDFVLPAHRPLVVEGAGGVLVPLSNTELMVDLMVHFGLPIVVVVKTYLGSINHTLATLEGLRLRRLPVAGLIFMGASAPASDNVVLAFSRVPELARLPWAEVVDRAFVSRQAERLRGAMHAFS